MSKITKVGIVKSNKMDKTAVVSVERLVRHPLYTRAFKKTSNFAVHDEQNRCQVFSCYIIDLHRSASRCKNISATI